MQQLIDRFLSAGHVPGQELRRTIACVADFQGRIPRNETEGARIHLPGLAAHCQFETAAERIDALVGGAAAVRGHAAAGVQDDVGDVELPAAVCAFQQQAHAGAGPGQIRRLRSDQMVARREFGRVGMHLHTVDREHLPQRGKFDHALRGLSFHLLECAFMPGGRIPGEQPCGRGAIVPEGMRRISRDEGERPHAPPRGM